MPVRKAQSKHKSKRSTKPKQRKVSSRGRGTPSGSPTANARRSHDTRSLISRRTDEALKAKKVPATKGGLAKWRGSRNRTDFPDVDTVHRKPKVATKKKTAPSKSSKTKPKFTPAQVDLAKKVVGKKPIILKQGKNEHEFIYNPKRGQYEDAWKMSGTTIMTMLKNSEADTLQAIVELQKEGWKLQK